MIWIPLSTNAQISDIIAGSFNNPVVIFKHSTRCSLSSMAMRRLEREESPQGVDFYFLDVLKNRTLSEQIANQFAVYHESPQVIIISKGVVISDMSHNAIRMEEIRLSLMEQSSNLV